MADTYSGAAIRSAHYAHRPPVAGVNVDHTTPDPEPDPFNPAPEPPAGQTGDVWTIETQTAGPSNQPNLAQQPVSHWFDGEPSVPTNVEYGRGLQAMQDRMMIDHTRSNYVPDSFRLYLHASQGHHIDWTPGRPAREAGLSVGDGVKWALAGRNSYDQNNEPNEVYGGGDPANVGRYRLGTKLNLFGMYDSPLGKFGQDAQLHSYTGLSPAFPQDKPQVFDTAPYTPNSTGTAHWWPAQHNQVPTLFTLPSETALTDYAVAEQAENTEFVDRGFH